jgi:hypothetical protein
MPYANAQDGRNYDRLWKQRAKASMSEEQLAAASAAKSEYNREWYLLNNHKHKARVNAAKRLGRARLKKILRRLRTLYRCMDCKQRHPWYVMEFDHVPGRGEKLPRNVLAIVTTRKALAEELAKCDLVCANCHKIRTFTRNQQGHLL